MAYAVKYGVDLKAIREVYPDEENSKLVLDNLLLTVEGVYESMRSQVLLGRSNDSLNLAKHNLPTDTVETAEIGSYSDVVSASYEVTQGMTYNDVVTVDALVTFTTDDAEAVKLLNKIDIAGTYYIEPTFRVTGY